MANPWDELKAIARGEMRVNWDDSGAGDMPPSPPAGEGQEAEPGPGSGRAISPLQVTKYVPPRMDNISKQSIVRAFRESVKRCNLSLVWGQSAGGLVRLRVTPIDGMAAAALQTKLDIEPWIEAALLWGMAQGDGRLMGLIKARTREQVPETIPEPVVLPLIGADERITALNAERAEFDAGIEAERRGG